MTRPTITALLAVAVLCASVASAKIPPPPPLDEKGKAAAEEKKKKDAEAADKAKADDAAAQDRAVKNYQDHMRKTGKPVPKPTPIAAAAPPKAPAKDDKAKAPAKDDKAGKK